MKEVYTVRSIVSLLTLRQGGLQPGRSWVQILAREIIINSKLKGLLLRRDGAQKYNSRDYNVSGHRPPRALLFE